MFFIIAISSKQREIVAVELFITKITNKLEYQKTSCGSQEIPLEILLEKAEKAIGNLLPDKSKKRYEQEYNGFEEWMAKKKVNVINEAVILAYFADMVCNDFC